MERVKDARCQVVPVRQKLLTQPFLTAPSSRGVSTTDESAVTPVRVRTPVVLKPRKVCPATQTVDATTHGGPLALRHSRRTTAGRKLDTILEAEKEPLPPPEPEPAGTELEGEDISKNVDGTKAVQKISPVTAIPVRKANTPEPPNQLVEIKTKVRTQYFVYVGQ